MSGPSAWVLNLEAERELERPDAHTASANTRARWPELLRALSSLIGPDDVVVEDDTCVRAEYRGRAWCPTPRALERLARAGATPVAAPAFDVLRRVNHRRFCAALGSMLPGAAYVDTLADLERTIAGSSPSGHWLLKRAFGFAGKGRRRVAAGALETAAIPWALASFKTGEGLQVEPWVEREGDFALHGFIAQDGAITWGESTEQLCDERGTWMATRPYARLSADEREALFQEGERTASALITARYFGPFGIDAFRWREGAHVRFNARSEINARYSMGWAVGMRDRRADLA